MFQDKMITRETNVYSWDVLLTSILDFSFSDTIQSHSDSQWEKNDLCGVKLCSLQVLPVCWSLDQTSWLLELHEFLCLSTLRAPRQEYDRISDQKLVF